MKELLALLFFFTGANACSRSSTNIISMPEQKTLTYLALGDSYTIGESVPASSNFPNQVRTQLAEDSISLAAPRIIAKTGWTTDELQEGIRASAATDPLDKSYDFVSLLIGVNNQYRGRAVAEYRMQFEQLLLDAIRYAGGRADHVIVLSIPDWGVTPFASGRDRTQIAADIDAYNETNADVSNGYHVHYINITPWTREASGNPALLAGDGLHPSALEYKRWAQEIAGYIRSLQ